VVSPPRRRAIERPQPPRPNSADARKSGGALRAPAQLFSGWKIFRQVADSVAWRNSFWVSGALFARNQAQRRQKSAIAVIRVAAMTTGGVQMER
jgi:hypothetical protein